MLLIRTVSYGDVGEFEGQPCPLAVGTPAVPLSEKRGTRVRILGLGRVEGRVDRYRGWQRRRFWVLGRGGGGSDAALEVLPVRDERKERIITL